MLVELRSKFYRVSFAHDNPQAKVMHAMSEEGELKEIVVQPKRRSTSFCFINVFDHAPSIREDGTTVASGQVECSKHDVFSKAMGRKLALINAIKKSDFNREERGIIWRHYLKTGAKLS